MIIQHDSYAKKNTLVGASAKLIAIQIYAAITLSMNFYS